MIKVLEIKDWNGNLEYPLGKSGSSIFLIVESVNFESEIEVGDIVTYDVYNGKPLIIDAYDINTKTIQLRLCSNEDFYILAKFLKPNTKLFKQNLT